VRLNHQQTMFIYTAMDIEISSILMGILFLSTFFVPITWHQLSEKKKKNRTNHVLLEAARSANLNLALQDTWAGKFGIGLDSEKQQLIWVQMPVTPEEARTVIVQLREVARCTPKVSERHIKGLKNTTSVIEGIALQFTWRKPGKKPLLLDFYRDTHGAIQSTEYALANKWAGLINKQIERSG
jgi:cbb3-type cytochrome oxidase subunit 3